MKSSWTQSARLLGNIQGVVVQTIRGLSSSGKFMVTAGEGGREGGREGGAERGRQGGSTPPMSMKQINSQVPGSISQT